MQFIKDRDKGVCDMYGHSASIDTAKTMTRVSANPIILPVKNVEKKAIVSNIVFSKMMPMH